MALGTYEYFISSLRGPSSAEMDPRVFCLGGRLIGWELIGALDTIPGTFSRLYSTTNQPRCTGYGILEELEQLPELRRLSSASRLTLPRLDCKEKEWIRKIILWIHSNTNFYPSRRRLSFTFSLLFKHPTVTHFLTGHLSKSKTRQFDFGSTYEHPKSVTMLSIAGSREPYVSPAADDEASRSDSPMLPTMS